MSNTKDFIIEQLKQEIKGLKLETRIEKIGTVIKSGDGIAQISGLTEVMSNELLEFTKNQSENHNFNREQKNYGVALNLEQDRVGAIILGDYTNIKQGDIVKSTGKILQTPVGEEMIGRIINPLGDAIDGKEEIKATEFYPIEKNAPSIIMRESVNQPVQTGIKAIDSMIPIGRGQRELIIGDRQIGKTAIAIDTIINQRDQDMICIYVAIGQKESKIARIVNELKKYGAMDYTIVVVAGSSDSAALNYIAPYSGCAIGEYFMDKGRDVLIVYDDLSKHAVAYRQISLLLKRAPGREAYPGDIFYLHSRLLERAAKLNKEYGGGSLTALPIIETQAGDVSAYIPTNVISITDGQIYLEPNLFYQGIRPAINIGLSVSRVGGAAQTKAIKKVAGKLRLQMAQYRELAAFAQFGSDLDEQTQKQLELGKRLTEILKQEQYKPLPMANQVMILYGAINGLFNDIPSDKIIDFEKGLNQYLEEVGRGTLEKISKLGDLDENLEEKIKRLIENYKQIYK